MPICPDCSSSSLSKHGCIDVDRLSDKFKSVTDYLYKCDDCDCEFSERQITSTEIIVELHGTKECEECDGTGILQHGSAYERKCDVCKGTGKVSYED